MQQYQAHVAAVIIEADQELRRGLARAHGFDDVEEAARAVSDRVARELLRGLLKGADEELSAQKPAGWRIVASKERTLVTTVGPLKFERRLYRDEKGKPHLLLDEELNLPARIRVSPRLQEVAIGLCSQVPFEAAAKTLNQLLPSAPKAVTLHRLLGQLGERRQAEGEELRKQVFEHGEIVRGERKLSRLFVEADGAWIHLQRTERERNLEVRVGIAHEGWQRVAENEYELKKKQVHFETRAGSQFWEGFSARLAERYDLEDTEVVVGGDGADWIANGITYFRNAHFQLDRFHLARALRRVLPDKGWRSAYEAAIGGEAYKTLAALGSSDHPDAEAVREYVINNHRGLADYRLKEPFVNDDGLRALGAAEGNVDKTIANRMCKRGMAWTKSGARRMTRVLEARRNGVLGNYLPKRRVPKKQPTRLRKILRRRQANAIETPAARDWLNHSWAVEPSSRSGLYALLKRLGTPTL
jgi:Uncharacterised protein family (UPF0236)